MTDGRELRAILEKTQARVRDLEAKADELERRRNLAEQRARGLEAELAAARERVAQVEGRLNATGAAAWTEELDRLQNRIGTLELRLAQADSTTPQLPVVGVCSRCGSKSMTLLDPNASLQGKKGSSRVLAAVCSECGLVELNAEAPHSIVG